MAETNPPPPPFRPPSPTATSVSPTSYRSARQNELDALRSKGLAKIFNRHFTDATDKITLEREAADAALVEIIARKAELKANPKSFETDGLTITQLDALHMQLQKRKLTVQRKEQETKELYRRYVSQYGGSEAMARKALEKQDSAKLNSSITAMSSTMPILHENRESDIMRQTNLESARTKEKKTCVGVGSSTSRMLEDGSFYDNDPTRSPTNRVGRLNEKGSTVQSPPLLDITSELNSNSRLDSPGFIAPNGRSTTPRPHGKQSANKHVLDDPDSHSFGNLSGLDSSFMGGVMVGDDNDDDDADSIMSGLTSMDGATVAIAEFKLTEFLKEETDNIRKMLGINKGDDDDSDDDDQKSMATFQTNTSLESKKAAVAAKKAEDLVKKMEEDTAWMDNPDLLNDDSDEENDNGENSLQDSQLKPHWIAYYSDEHERVYYFNSDTKQTCWTEPRDAVIDKSGLDKSKFPDDNNCDEEDTVVVKDYTKAEPQEAQPQARSMADNLAAIDQYRPNSDVLSIGSGSISRTSRTSKVMIFKRKQALKRRRRNRILVVFTVVCSLVGIGLYKSREQWMPVLGLQTVRQKAIEEERVLKEAANIAAEKAREIRLQKEEEERKIAVEEQRKKTELASKRKAEKERKEAELAAKKKAELEAKKNAELEVKTKAESEAKKKAEEKRIQVELAAQKKAEEERIKVELAAQKKAEKTEKAAKKKAEIDLKNAELAARKKVEEEERLAKLAAKEKAEAERRVAELAAKEKAEEERRVADFAAKKAAEERRVAEIAANKAAEERRVAELAAKEKAEEERKVAELATKKAVEERRVAELAAKKAAEERRVAELAATEAEEERIRAELEAKTKAAKVKADEERVKAELQATYRVEKERKEKERKSAELKAEEERKNKEFEEKIREDERRKIREEEQMKGEVELAQAKDVASSVLFTRNKNRCHIPFAWFLIRRCRAAVKKTPLFDVKWLVDSMMQ